MNMDEHVNYKSIAMAHRTVMSDIWKRWHRDPDSLEGEERQLAEQMAEHQKYHDVWENIDNLSDHAFDPAKEENPFLHVSLHVTLERQLQSDEPPEAGRALERLIARGDDPHEARHAILRVLVQEMWHIMTHSEEFNQQRYCEELDKL